MEDKGVGKEVDKNNENEEGSISFTPLAENSANLMWAGNNQFLSLKIARPRELTFNKNK